MASRLQLPTPALGLSLGLLLAMSGATGPAIAQDAPPDEETLPPEEPPVSERDAGDDSSPSAADGEPDPAGSDSGSASDLESSAGDADPGVSNPSDADGPLGESDEPPDGAAAADVIEEEQRAPEEPPPSERDTTEAEAPEEEDVPFSWPTRLGPFQVETGVGRVRFGLATQLRVEFDSTANDDGTRTNNVTAQIRRLRTSMSGRFLDDRLSFAFQMNSVPGAFELIDMWIDGEILEDIRIRMGQLKIPFTRYRQQSFTRLLLDDWAPSTFFFGGERQLGFLVHDGPARPAFDYSLGLFAGENRRASHAVGLSTLYGEPITNDSNFEGGLGQVDDFHPELVGMIGHGSDDFSTGALTDAVGGDFRYLLTLSSAVDFAPVVTQDLAFRVAPEAWFKYEGLSVVAIGYFSLVETAIDPELVVGMAGLNLEVAYRFSRWMEVSARWDRTFISEALSTDARERADGIIAGATTPEEMASLADQYATTGLLRATNELSLGFNVYLIGHSLKWQTDASWQRRDLRTGAKDDGRVRTQLQFAF